jgi:hypothetical protein
MEKKKKTTKKIAFDFKTIKSFEDACKRKNIDPTQLPIVVVPEIAKQLIAAYKLMVIFLAINDGWEADFNNWDQTKYYPWYRCLSSGFGFVDSDFRCSNALTTVGSRLCTNTSEKALYIAEQFKSEYEDFILIKK